MIIDDQNRVVFIHIPKCAGTSIRRVLGKFDSYEGKWANAKSEHPELGRIDMGHLPLSILREYFPREYIKVQSYHSLAVLRDPYARFPSSLYQRLKMYGEKPVEQMSKAELNAALEETIALLSACSLGKCLPYDYIHFQRQTTYIFDQERQLVDNLYTMENLEALFQKLSDLTGVSVGLEEETSIGHSRVYKTNVRRALGNLIKPLYTPEVQKFIPATTKARIVRALYKPANQKFSDLLQTNMVRDFVTSYYAEDIDLYNFESAKRTGS